MHYGVNTHTGPRMYASKLTGRWAELPSLTAHITVKRCWTS